MYQFRGFFIAYAEELLKIDINNQVKKKNHIPELVTRLQLVEEPPY